MRGIGEWDGEHSLDVILCEAMTTYHEGTMHTPTAEGEGTARHRNFSWRFVTRRTVDRHFGRAFHQAVQRAPRIHFALDGMLDIGAAVKAGRRGFRPGNFTNAELHYIMTNTRLLEKTIFYREGTVVPTPTFPFVGGEHTP